MSLFLSMACFFYFLPEKGEGNYEYKINNFRRAYTGARGKPSVFKRKTFFVQG